jgi:hypothetical protein
MIGHLGKSMLIVQLINYFLALRNLCDNKIDVFASSLFITIVGTRTFDIFTNRNPID